jgi:hypothetical protein
MNVRASMMNGGKFARHSGIRFSVIAGLDPAIHLLRKSLAKMDGCAGQARA